MVNLQAHLLLLVNKKDDKNKHQLVVDIEVAHIIGQIFNMKIEGYSSKAIVDFLNRIEMVTLSKNKGNNGDNFNTGFVVKKEKWDAKTRFCHFSDQFSKNAKNI